MKHLFVAVAAAIFMTSCADTEIYVPPPVTSQILHDDLPAPEGFLYEANDTYTSPTGAWRVTTQILRGNRRVDGAAKFYAEIFPKHGWTLESQEAPSAAEARLSFVKQDERCKIEIMDESVNSVGITLKVGPKK